MQSPQAVSQVLIVDDDALAREALEVYLSLADDFAVVGKAENAKAAMQILDTTQTDIVLLDINMPGIDGTALTKKIRQTNDSIAIIMLTSFDDERLLHLSLEAGANGYLLKNVRAKQLISAMRAVLSGLPILAPEMLKRLESAHSTKQQSQMPDLTARESEVLDHLAKGYSNRQIAKTLFLSESTIKMHISALIEKFGTTSRLETVAKAYRLGYQPRVSR